jgi:hypothetical protein
LVGGSACQAVCRPGRAHTTRRALAPALAGADPSKLWVAEAFVTKGQYARRIHFHGRGYSSMRKTRHSHLNVHVQQMDDAFLAAAAVRRPPRLLAPIMVRLQDRARLERGPPARRSTFGGVRGGGGGG